MTREEMAKAARRFYLAVDGLEFISHTSQSKEKDQSVSKPQHEVKRGASLILYADSEEEAKALADKLNKLTYPFIEDELNRLKSFIEKEINN